MTNPYAPPRPQHDEDRTATRLRLASLTLFVFGACLTLPELYSNASDLLQNPIGNLMGTAIIAATAVAAYAEWFPNKRLARLGTPALVILSIVASVVFIRFVLVFVPILTPTWAEENTGVVMGFVFSIAACAYTAIFCWVRMFANATSSSG